MLLLQMHLLNHLLFTLIGISCAATIGSSAPSWKHILHEKRDLTLDSWIRQHRAHADMIMPLRIGMTQSNLDFAHQMLMELSDPTSSRYSQYYTAEELHEVFAPSKSTVSLVQQWLRDSGFLTQRVGLSLNKQWIQLDATVQEIESLLKTEFYVWKHGPSNKINIACDELVQCITGYSLSFVNALPRYYVPEHLQKHIDYITPGIKLHVLENSPQSLDMQKRAQQVQECPHIPPFQNYSECVRYMWPECHLKLYNITEGKYALKGNELGIYATGNNEYNQSDSDQFFKRFYPRIPQGTSPKVLSVDGGIYHATLFQNGGETNVDTQTAWPIIYPQNMIIWEVNDKHYDTGPIKKQPHGWFNTWLDAIDGSYCNFSADGETGNSPKIDPIYPDHHKGGYNHTYQCGIYKPTNVISISYGSAESYLPAYYERRQCIEYMKLGLQGITILAATQDLGTGASYGGGKDNCYPGTNGTVFAPNWPAACPYVTAVGSTGFDPKFNGDAHAFIASNQRATRYSGGGFSNVWETPEYQKKAVSNFLTKYPPSHKSYATKNNKNVGQNGGVFNRAGRGIPDVSAIGYQVTVFGKGFFGKGSSGTESRQGGTSWSTPLWAGIITRINEERLCAGKNTVGFINPVLYANHQAMDDITKGENHACLYNRTGFKTAPGWDPVSGLGTPRYQDLLDVFMKLP